MLATPSSATESSPGAGFHAQFRDTLDGKFDVSEWVLSRYGFIPLPTIITEPAVGVGIGGALLFLKQNPKGPGQRPIPPDVSALAGAYTSNGTWVVGAAHMGYWRQDRVRYKGVVGFTGLNLTYYGESSTGDDFSLDAFLTLQELTYRLGSSNFFAGAQYVFANSSAAFDPGEQSFRITDDELDSKIGGVGGVFGYDSRDNTFTPNRGGKAQALFRYFGPGFASDWEYRRLDVFGYSNAPVNRFITLGVRADYRQRMDDAPFYTLPYVDLRGIPAMRYQGERVLVLETEERWDFSSRWSLVAFAGIGHTNSPNDLVDQPEEANPGGEEAYSLGAGIRYLIARQLGIRMGVDIARGPEDWAFYLQFGSAWSRY